MNNKKRFTVEIYMPDLTECGQGLSECLDCGQDTSIPSLVTMTLSAPTAADARRFVKSRFEEAKIFVREL